MSDEKQPSKAQEVLMQHGEKIALGVALLLFFGYGLMALASSGPGAVIDEVKSSADTIKKESGNSHDAFKSPDLQSSSDAQTELVVSWDAPSPGEEVKGSDWAGSLLTKGTGDKIDFVAIKEKKVAMGTLSWGDASPSAKGVKLTWTMVDPEEEKDTHVVKIDWIHVERRNPDGSRKLLKKLNGDATSYLDDDVKKKTKYKYRMIPYTKDKKWKTSSTGRGTATEWKEVTTIDIWKITFSTPSPDWDGEWVSKVIEEKVDGKGTGKYKIVKESVKGRVYVKIEKDDKEFGKLVITRFHVTGQKIGWWLEEYQVEAEDRFKRKYLKDVKEITSKHPRRIKGENQRPDFDTKLTITAIKMSTVPVMKKTCKDIRRDVNGNSTGKCRIVEKELYKITEPEVWYVDPTGKKSVWRKRDPKAEANAKPDFCKFHKKNPPE